MEVKKNINFKKIVIAIFIILFSLILLGILPDLLIHLRNILKQIPFIQGIISKKINDKDYAKIMVTPLFSCIAILVSILAFHTAKSTGKIHAIQKNASIIMATTNMKRIIETNTDVINNLKNNTGNIAELLVESNVVREASYLYSAKKISLDQFLLFNKFSKSVSKIHYFHNQGNDEDKNVEIKEFCKNFFKEGCIEYKTELQQLKDLLEKIEKEVK